jgi:hypothetical protein
VINRVRVLRPRRACRVAPFTHAAPQLPTAQRACTCQRKEAARATHLRVRGLHERSASSAAASRARGCVLACSFCKATVSNGRAARGEPRRVRGAQTAPLRKGTRGAQEGGGAKEGAGMSVWQRPPPVSDAILSAAQRCRIALPRYRYRLLANMMPCRRLSAAASNVACRPTSPTAAADIASWLSSSSRRRTWGDGARRASANACCKPCAFNVARCARPRGGAPRG